MKTQLFINKFDKGQKENPNLGMGNLVGIDTYSKKNVAILAKKGTLVTTLPAEPHFLEVSASGTWTWVQCGDGSVYYSANGGVSWTTTGFSTGSDTHGNGLIYFQGYMFAFTDTKIWYHDADPTSGSWTDWTTGKSLGLLQNFYGDPITGLHFPFLYPNSRGVYFGNGGAGGTSNAVTTTLGASTTVGFFGQVGTTIFNPAGTINVDFAWNNGILSLPSTTYSVASIDFLPPSSLAISLVAFTNPAQGADLITWDTVSTNKFSPPLHIYSNSIADGTTFAGIKQLYNRNQVLYAVTGGNHSIYETNGSSFNLVEDIGLNSNVRSYNGGELDYPVYFDGYPQAICVVGNKLLTGISTSVNTAVYPPNSLNTVGLFPLGIWSIAFDKNGGHTLQCEYVIQSGFEGNTSPATTGSYGKITCIRSVPQQGSSTTIMAGFSLKNNVASTDLNGVILIDLYKYIDNKGFTAIESELFEIGTAINPQVVNLIEINLVKKLLAGQTIDISYRISQDQDWTVIDTYVGDGTTNYYHTDKNPIGATQFIQLRVRMETGSPNQNSSPQLKTVILS